ncbi:MAG TPA: beta-ketoacyl synthase N-terminal-like domain-containing protein [Polyangiaceae bacterium]|nr:beta-ketoacyl synthase N-terminal-like domain-containing protein [Polyangiaceae bacterium]
MRLTEAASREGVDESPRGVFVTARGALSSLGANAAEHLIGYRDGSLGLHPLQVGSYRVPLGALSASARARVSELVGAHPQYARLDPSVLFAILATREALATKPELESFAVCLGSSRGATERLEQTHRDFLNHGEVKPATSPTTTLGNLSSNVARDRFGPNVSVELSSACTSSLHAVLFGYAYLRAGLGAACLVGGAEAPLTPFTLAQLDALGLLNRDLESATPCRPLSGAASATPESTMNRMVLGEGACVLLLQRLPRSEAARRGALAEIVGIGSALEKTPHPASMSADGQALQQAMRAALAAQVAAVDAVVVHAPGTARGDKAELAALAKVFGSHVPPLCSNKWQLGHTFGASGAFGIDFALALLAGAVPATAPFPSALSQPTGAVRRVLVNGAGFGGTAVSVLLQAVAN